SPSVPGTTGVAARTQAGSKPEEGVSLFLVPGRSKGLTVTQLKTVDMTRRLCHLKFDGVEVNAGALVGAENQGWPILRRTLDVAVARPFAGVCCPRPRAPGISGGLSQPPATFAQPP